MSFHSTPEGSSEQNWIGDWERGSQESETGVCLTTERTQAAEPGGYVFQLYPLDLLSMPVDISVIPVVPQFFIHELENVGLYRREVMLEFLVQQSAQSIS